MQNYLLTTNRLGLRFITKNDIDCFFELEKDPEVQKFTPSGTRTYEQTQELIEKCLAEYELRGLPCFLAFHLGTNELVGSISFFLWETGDIEIGYCLHKKFWGKGYATEAVTCLLQWAKNNISVDYITAYSSIENPSSLRVLEKSGMQCFKQAIEKGVEGRYYRIKNK